MRTLAPRIESVPAGGSTTRWFPIVLVSAAIAISYFDRQTLPEAIAAIQHNIPIFDQQFSYLQTAFLLSYAALYAGGGRLLDRTGTRRGFLLIMTTWSIACALHGFAVGFGLLLGHSFGYETLILTGSFHIIGFLAVVLYGGKSQPSRSHDLALFEATEA